MFVIDDHTVQNLVVKNVVKIAEQMGLPYSETQIDVLDSHHVLPGTSNASLKKETEEESGYKNLNSPSFCLLLKKMAIDLSFK